MIFSHKESQQEMNKKGIVVAIKTKSKLTKTEIKYKSSNLFTFCLVGWNWMEKSNHLLKFNLFFAEL